MSINSEEVQAPKREGTPYDELNAPPIIGLLAHSQSLGRNANSLKLYDCIEGNLAKHADHPRELLDIVCVADTATIPLGKHILMGNELTQPEMEELKDIGAQTAVAALYVIQDEDKRSPELDFAGAILAGLIYELTQRLAFEDASIRPWADHLAALGFYGGIGRPSYCFEDVLSEAVRNELNTRPRENEMWSKWSRNLP